jgi:hypothetical protein
VRCTWCKFHTALGRTGSCWPAMPPQSVSQ